MIKIEKQLKISALSSVKLDEYEYLTGHGLQPLAIKSLIKSE